MSNGMSGGQRFILALGILVVIPLLIFSCMQLLELGTIYNDFGVCLEKCERKYIPELYSGVTKVQVVQEKALYKHADCRVKCDREVRKADSRHLKLALVIGMMIVNLVIIAMIFVGIVRKHREDLAFERIIKKRVPQLDKGTEYDGSSPGIPQDPKL